MIIEQIRYFLGGEDPQELLRARRTVSAARRDLNLPAGHILESDENSETAPCVVWQCGYEDEGEMGAVETRLIGNPEYEAARAALAQLAHHVEVELYTIVDEDEA